MTEMTSSATLLTESLAGSLIDAGLDQFTVSIDGASGEACRAIRTGASGGDYGEDDLGRVTACRKKLILI